MNLERIKSSISAVATYNVSSEKITQMSLERLKWIKLPLEGNGCLVRKTQMDKENQESLKLDSFS